MAPPETAQKIMDNNTYPEAAETAETGSAPAVAPSTACSLSSDTERMDYLESLLGRFVMEKTARGSQKSILRSDVYMAPDVSIYVRNNAGHVIHEGNGRTWREAVDDLRGKYTPENDIGHAPGAKGKSDE